MKKILNIIINSIDKKMFKGKLPKIINNNFPIETEKRDNEPFCVPTKEHIKMMKKYLIGDKDDTKF